jgi:hypothetical protein
MTVAPAGTSAWRALFSAISRPRDANMAAMRSTMASSRTSFAFITSAIASRVMSSCVGPRPPQTITASLRARAVRRASTMRSRLSPTFVWKCESMPANASRSPIHDELVSTI